MANKNWAGTILNGMDDLVDNLKWGDKTILRSNQPINSIGKFIMGESDTGIRGVLSNLSKGADDMTLGKAISNAYHVGEGEARKLNYKAIAGTYIGAAAAGRVITGGGLYRNSSGNADVAGVPFI